MMTFLLANLDITKTQRKLWPFILSLCSALALAGCAPIATVSEINPTRRGFV